MIAIDPNALLLQLREAVRAEHERPGHLVPLSEQLLIDVNQAIQDLRSDPHLLEHDDRLALCEALIYSRDDLLTQRELKLFLLAQDGVVPDLGRAISQEILFCSILESRLRDYRKAVRG